MKPKEQNKHAEEPDPRMQELRSIILKEVDQRLEELEDRLNDPHLRAEELSQVLVESIVIKSGESDQLTNALLPSIEEGLQESVSKNPKTIADALFPIMGPALRKSILETIRSMVESLNKVVEQSFTIRGLRWRWEAIRTGKTYGDIVFLHNMRYRVEQVYFIHRESGILLSHAVNGSLSFQDPDAVSAMLTAIQDFMKDSFNSKENEEVNTLQVGELAVWVESGPYAVIAAVIRGTPNPSLRDVLAKANEDLHLWHRRELSHFEGQTSVFDKSRDNLEKCLLQDSMDSAAERKPRLWIPAALCLFMLFALVGWGINHLIWNKRLMAFKTSLNDVPGIVVTQVEKTDGSIQVQGLRDRDANSGSMDPSQLSGQDIQYKWKPYLSLNPDIVMCRVQRQLSPPDSVRLSYDQGTLTLTGEASGEFFERLSSTNLAAMGIEKLDTENLIQPLPDTNQKINYLKDLTQAPDTLTMKIVDKQLVLGGTASFAWYHDSIKKLIENPWNLEVKDSGMELDEVKQIHELGQRLALANETCLFDADNYSLNEACQKSLEVLIQAIKDAFRLGENIGQTVTLQLNGHSDSNGSDEANMAISRHRAQEVFAYLKSNGIPEEKMTVLAWGATKPNSDENADNGLRLDRRVELKFIIQDPVK